MYPGDLAQICVFYALTPLHAGSGQALGAVDLPIQRERHTGWPHVQASGVKGAFRDWFYRYWEENGAQSNDKSAQLKGLTERIFGREEGRESEEGQAGAISITDARLLAFPVRSNVSPFVWVTCPEILSRLNRDLSLLPNNKLNVPIINPTSIDKYVSVVGGTKEKEVVLEDLAVSEETQSSNVSGLGQLFGELAPQVTRLMVISDQNFSFLVQSATEIQPQIRIDIETGTAQDGSLRYQELLPSDSVLYCLVFLTKERINAGGLMPQVIKDNLLQAISTHIQMGGDFTLGRGFMEVNWFPKEKKGG